jgi:anti-repressor protein
MTMPKNPLTLFQNPEFGAVRATQEDGTPLFAARDVAVALGYQRPADAVTDHCKGVVVLPTPSAGGIQATKFIPESDVYRLIFRSKLPAAERFQDWVVEEVLPTIRRTGGYRLPGTFVEALQALVSAEQEKQALALENAEMRPKAEFHDAVTATADLCELAVAAQVIGLPYGRNTLFQRLREMGVLISGGNRHNLPKQRFVEAGYFTVKESTYTHERETHVRFTPLMTQKGVEWLRRKLLSPVSN